MNDNESELKNIVEAALLAAEAPLSISALTSLFPEDAAPTQAELKETFEQLELDYEGRGVELKRVGKGWRFQSREKYSPWLRKLAESRPPRYSRAFLETLAIIAYRQPVTRGDIEEIRGVQVSSDIMRGLMDRDWVKEVGHRDVPGRPALLGTTQQFLEYFNLETLSELPPLLERREASDIARELNLRLPLEAEADPVRRDGANDPGQAGGGADGGEDREADSQVAASDEGAPATGVEREAPTAAPGGEPDDSDGPASEADTEHSGEADFAPGRAEQGGSERGDDGHSPEFADKADEAGDEAGDDADSRPTAQVIPFDDVLNSREGDGENS